MRNHHRPRTFDAVRRGHPLHHYEPTETPGLTRIVYRPTRCTCFEFRKPGDDQWRDRRQWPTYDDHRADDGLPAGLARLYERYKPQIRAALADEAIPDDVQPSLFAF